MSNKIASIVVANLTTSDPWADQFWVDMFYDAGHTQFVQTQYCQIQGGGQREILVFNGLEVGHTYFLLAYARVSANAGTSTPTAASCPAGNINPPVVTYTINGAMTPAGLFVTIQPATSNTDINHYEWYYVGNDPTPPAASTTPTGRAVLSASGTFGVFCGMSNGNQFVYARAINTTGIAQAWVNLTTEQVPQQIKIRAIATGNGSFATLGQSQLLYNDVTQSFSVGLSARGYNVAGINRATGVLDWFEHFDTWADSTQPGIMATALLTHFTNRVIVVFTFDEPQQNRLLGGLPEAIASIGGSSTNFRSTKFQPGSCYILVGQNGLGEGNGIELYSGVSVNDPAAYCETSFFIHNGSIVGLPGGATAAFQVDGALGAISANGSVPKSFSNAFTYTADTSSVFWSWNLNVYRIDGTVTNYAFTNFAVLSLAASTKYYFYPYAEDAPGAFAFGSVTMVFEVPGATGVYGYPSMNYACVQEANLASRVSLSSGALSATTTGSGSGGGSSGGSGICLHAETLVREKTKGLVPLFEIRKDDWLDAPEGWVRVKHNSLASQELWIGTVFEGNDDTEFLSTPNHCWETESGEKKESAKLSMSDLIPTKSGLTFPKSIRVISKLGNKAQLMLDSESHTFYIGRDGILTHNLSELMCP